MQIISSDPATLTTTPTTLKLYGSGFNAPNPLLKDTGAEDIITFGRVKIVSDTEIHVTADTSNAAIDTHDLELRNDAGQCSFRIKVLDG